MAGIQLIAAALLAILTGCAAFQSQRNANDMASTISRIREEQVLQNIGVAIDDRSFVPSGIVLGTGQANVIVGMTPTFRGTGITSGAPGYELDIAPTDTWTAQWQFTSITEQGDLRRLRNVYALIVSTDEQYDTLERYFHPQAAAANGAAQANDSDAVFRGLFEGLLPPAEKAPPAPPAPPVVTTRVKRTSSTSKDKPPPSAAPEPSGRPAAQHVIPWPDAKDFLITGDSIDCRLFQAAKVPSTHGVPFRRWLFWRKSGGPWLPQDPGGPVEDVGHYGNWDLGVTSRACLDDFVILLQGVTPSASSVTSQGAKYMLQ
jgi:hypothetical protein